MGCLRNIINLIIFGLAIIGFLSIGGKEYLDNNIMPAINKINSEFQMNLDKTGKKFTELSLKEIGGILWASVKTSFITTRSENGLEITEIKGLMGYDTQIAEDKTSGQRMVTIDTKDKVLLDLNKTDKAELKAEMLSLARKHKALPMNFDDIEILELGKWKVMSKDLRFARVMVEDKKTGNKIEAIVSTYPDDANSKLLISFAEKSRFSKKAAEKFYKKAH